MRFPVERLISDLTGGMVPNDGDVIIRKGGVWVFEPLPTSGSGAPAEHDHDDDYYTETEVDDLLAGKADSGHTHPGLEVYAVKKADGDVAVSSTTYVALDTAMDIVIPAVAGDTILIGIVGMWLEPTP